MALDIEKFLAEAKLLVALWENSAANVKIYNIIECIKSGANVNIRFCNNANNTPLHIAVIKGDKEIVNVLLKYGAEANIANDEGKTAIEIAKELPGRSDIAELFSPRGEPAAGTAGAGAVVTRPATVARPAVAGQAGIAFKKRAGTAGVRGQLYETKLLTLVYLRVWSCDHITQFHLGTNVDEIGDMDDVCLRFKTTTDDIAVFLQAKHKQDIEKRIGIEDFLCTKGDFSLPKYFGSYRKIRSKFNVDSDDIMFRGKYEKMKIFYVIYTTVKDKIERSKKKLIVNNEVLDLLATEDQSIFQLRYDDQCIHLLSKTIVIENLKDAGKNLLKLILAKKHGFMFQDDNIRSFHVVLAQKVVEVTPVNPGGCRKGTFREEFFSTNEELLIPLRETLYREAATTRKLTKGEIESKIRNILDQPNPETISELIGCILTYDSKTDTLKFIDEKRFPNHNLNHLQVAQSVVNEAFEIAGQKRLRSLPSFDLPAAFGNLDIATKTEKRLTHLASKIFDVMESAESKGNIVICEGEYAKDKWLKAGEIAANEGGIASMVGNLLVYDENYKLKFNLNVDELGKNAKSLLEKLKEKNVDFDRYRFEAENEEFPRLLLLATEEEKKFVRNFLDNLYFYTCQAKENKLQGIAAAEVQAHVCVNNFSKAESCLRSNALFLKIHNEIQIWWMTELTADYLTWNTFEDIFKDLLNKGLLSFLNFIYLNDMNNAGIEFNSEAVKALSVCWRDTCDSKVVVIHTDVPLLTCHKLVQFFRGDEDYLFLDIDYLCRISAICLTMITDELAKTKIRNVVIICDEISEYKDVFDACDTKKIILVTGTNDVPLEANMSMTDESINLTDLTDETQQKLLKNQFTYQGINVSFADVYDENTKCLVSPKVLEKMINKEHITLGQTLVQSTYEEIKHYYVQRILQRNVKNQINIYSNDVFSSEYELSIKTLIDQDICKRRQNNEYNDIMLIIDGPGMGKSTFLTHLSLETKRQYPKIWIQRINLIDHSKQFHEWHEKKVHIDTAEVLKFLVKIVITKETFRSNVKLYDICDDINLEINDGKITYVNCEKNVLKALELDMFMHCFKNGQTVFIFDGFDEICPHYKSEVKQLLKSIAWRSPEGHGRVGAEPCVWISSRPYNDMREILEKDFGRSYILQAYSYDDIKVFLDKYMRRNLDISDLNSKQLKNIVGFFEYMKNSNVHTLKSSGLVDSHSLHTLYITAFRYLKSEIKRSHLTDNILMYAADLDIEDNILYNEMLYKVTTPAIASVPLHIYIFVSNFYSQIKDMTLSEAEDLTNQWDINSNTLAFYQRFVETKLKTIRFEEKNRMDLYNPDVRLTYEKERKEFLEKHKKLGYYAVCERDEMNESVLGDDIEEIIRTMKVGEEKTGLVDRIVAGKPKFIHYTFAEYFAVEFITDYLKSCKPKKQEEMLKHVLDYFVMFTSDTTLTFLNCKLKSDVDLINAISTIDASRCILNVLVEQCRVQWVYEDMEDSGLGGHMYTTALDKVYFSYKTFGAFLIDAIVRAVDETNLANLIYLIQKSKFFENVIMSSDDHDNTVGKILDCIRKIDEATINELLPYKCTSCVHVRRSKQQFIETYRKFVNKQNKLNFEFTLDESF